ncbi:MAG: fasciclin domain-containing protein [Phycisphaerae bacterium]|nr:fasciclin domain-containing protein [Phycisphaerae bacterium]
MRFVLSAAAVAAVAGAGAFAVEPPAKPETKPATPATPAAKPEAKPEAKPAAKPEVKADDVIAVAEKAGNFKTLIAAIKAAGLTETLKGKGPFTIFAPTDEAFGKLPKGTLDDLLKPENKEKLGNILKYHVVSGKVGAADVMKMKGAKTLEGSEAAITVKDKDVMVDAAKVTKTDIAASNGVIHVIDAVIMPKAKDAKKAEPKHEDKKDGGKK